MTATTGSATTSAGMAPTGRYVEQVMGMPISLALRGRHRDDAPARAAWAAVVAELRAVEATFSTWRDDSLISRLGRGEVALDDCPVEVHEVMALGERARIESAGAFDIRRPDPNGAGGPRHLDPSGVVKGWATERAARRHLFALPDTDVCLSAGGDMVARTLDPNGRGWSIGIEHPLDASRLVALVPLHNGAVATSGTAHRGSHVVDPRTGAAATALASVTVVGDSLTWVDIEATAAMAMGDDALAWLRTRPDRTGLVVTADGTVTTYG